MATDTRIGGTMNGKFHKIRMLQCLSAFCLLSHHAAIRAADQCFTTVEEFLTKSHGENYRDDENISAHVGKFGNKEFLIVADKTSGTNYARTLLYERLPNQLCLVLQTPPIAQLTSSTVDVHEFPNLVSTDQAPPGMPQREITYLFNWDRFRYDATMCKEISSFRKALRAKTISCMAFLEQ